MSRDEKTRQRDRLVKGLTGLLADTYVLCYATQASHWNVEGPQFHSLHRMFEEQHEEMAAAIDVVAERIRCLGSYTPATLTGLAKHSRILQPGEPRGAKAMLSHLIEAHLQVVHRAIEVRGEAEEILDESTADLLIERLRVHEKMLWMLRSQAGGHTAELAPVERIGKAG